MLTTYLVLLWGLLAGGGATDKPTKPIPHLPGRLDGVTTAAQAQQFVQAYRKEYQQFRLLNIPKYKPGQRFMLTQEAQDYEVSQWNAATHTSTKSLAHKAAEEFDCSGARSCLGTSSLTSWMKADFDGDGRDDLLAYGYFQADGHLGSTARATVCLLAQGAQGVREVSTGAAYGDPCYLLQVVPVQGRAAIRRATQTGTWSTAKKEVVFSCKMDTLICAQTRFIVYNAHPKDYSIQKIVFSTTRCYGSCPVFTMQINQDQTARCELTQVGRSYTPGAIKKPGVFTAVIDKKSFKEVWNLINYVNFPKLPEDQSRLNPDLSTYTLSVTYADGVTKTIKDSGLTHNAGLGQVFDLLLNLPDTQAWK